MSDAATLTAQAATLADDLIGKSANAAEAVMLLALAAARIASKADKNDPANSPSSLLNILAAGFNAAMAIETAGQVKVPNRTFGMAE